MAGSQQEAEIKDKLSNFFLGKEDLPLKVCVLAVMKFIHDGYSYPLGSRSDPCCEGFDLILTDPEGKSLSKAFLTAEYNVMAQRQILRRGSRIKITSLTEQSNIHNSGSGRSMLHPCLRKMAIVDRTLNEEEVTALFADLLSSRKYKDLLIRPLFSYRKYYISHWSSGDPPVGWVKPFPQGDFPSKADMLSRGISLVEAVGGVSASTVTCYSSVVGRVTNKSAIIHFARPTDQHGSSCPFQFYVELCDQTCSVPVVFWNGNCLAWHGRVRVGDILALSRFTVREVSDSRASTFNRLSGLRPASQTRQVEINLNADRNPIAVVHKVAPEEMPPALHPPEVSLILNSLADVKRVDFPVLGNLGGVVCHCGRVERSHHMPAPPGVLQGRPPPKQDRGILPLLQGKWVWLVDSSHPDPFPVYLSSCSQPEVFDQVGVGSVLVVTNGNIWRLPRTISVYASCSMETQLYLVDRDCPPHLTQLVDNLLMWRASSGCRNKMAAYSSPCLAIAAPTTPTTLSQLQVLLQQPDSDITVVSEDEDLWSKVGQLQHHQHRLFVLSASVLDVMVTGLPPRAAPTTQATPKDSAYESQAQNRSQSQSQSRPDLPMLKDETWKPGPDQPKVVGACGQNIITGHPTWHLLMRSESGRTHLNAQFCPLPCGHWLHMATGLPTSPDPLRRLLGTGVATPPGMVEGLEGVERGLFRTTFSCLLSAYCPGGLANPHISLLRAFALH